MKRKLRGLFEKLCDKASEHSSLILPLAKTARLLSQSRESGDKLYSFHEPEVSCLAKGKARTPYGFGSKVCLTLTQKSGLVLAIQAYRGNPHDGQLLQPALASAYARTGQPIRQVPVDRGFYGHFVQGVQVSISRTRGLSKTLKRHLRRRQAIEPW